MDITTTATCFALLISQPGNPSPSFLIQDYPTIEAAETAKLDLSGTDAVTRIKSERYKASPQYLIDQARQKKAEEDRIALRKKQGCLADEWNINQPPQCRALVSVFGDTLTVGRMITRWDVQVSLSLAGNPMIKQEPKEGDLYVLDAMKSFRLVSKANPIWIDVRVKAVDDATVFCTIANRSAIVPISKDVFMRVVEEVDPITRPHAIGSESCQTKLLTKSP